MDEFELEKTYVTIDVDRLTKSNIKQIVLPLHKFIEWQSLDVDGNTLHKSEIFDSCLNTIDAQKAKELNNTYMRRIYNLLDEDAKTNINFEDFVD